MLMQRRSFVKAGLCLAASALGVSGLAGCGRSTGEISGYDVERTGSTNNEPSTPVDGPLPDVPAQGETTPAPDSPAPVPGVFDFAAKTVLLNSGFPMPLAGLGTWTLNNATAESSTYEALKAGMRLIDTARYYGCEAGVGRGVARAIREGIITREEVFITSKIMPSDYARAAGGIEESLADLNLSYVDLMLIHQPGSRDAEVYRAMEAAVAEGTVRSIGISNYYTAAALDEVLGYATITPAVIQNENHLRYQGADFQAYAASLGIVMEAWYPFGGRAHVRSHLGDAKVAAIAANHDKTPAQVIARWQMQTGFVVIPGSSNADHIRENAAIFDFSLTDEELAQLRSLDTGRRYENW